MKNQKTYPLSQKLVTLKTKGMPVYAVNLKDPINNESRLTKDDPKTDRRAEMTLFSPLGPLLIEQAGRRPHLTLNYKGTEMLPDEEETVK